jgi:hypothetical protein
LSETRPPNALIGILRIARFRADGLDQFTATPQAFLNSLAPLIAFPLVGGALMALGGAGIAAITDLLSSCVALLAPPVLSHVLARHWGREGLWLRYAVAFNWCQWAVPMMAVVSIVAMLVLVAVGLGRNLIAVLGVCALIGYALLLHWFLAAHALRLSAARAAGLVLFANLGAAALVLLPRLLTGGFK